MDNIENTKKKIEFPLPKFDPLSFNDPKNHVQLNDGDTYYELLGSEGPLVVCMHGISWWSFVYQELSKDLVKQGYRVLLFDFYGRGFSDTPLVTYNPYFLCNQTKELLDKLNFKDEKVTLIGMSMGGVVASCFTSKYPERVSKLILLAPAIIPVALPFIARFITTPYIGSLFYYWFGQKFLLNDLRNNRFQRDFTDREAASEIIQSLFDRVEWQVEKKPNFVSALHSTLSNFPFSDGALNYLKNIGDDVPIMCMLGTEDQLVPYSKRDMLTEANPKIEIITAKGVGHSVLFEAKDLVSQSVIDFILLQSEIYVLKIEISKYYT